MTSRMEDLSADPFCSQHRAWLHASQIQSPISLDLGVFIHKAGIIGLLGTLNDTALIKKLLHCPAHGGQSMLSGHDLYLSSLMNEWIPGMR